MQLAGIVKLVILLVAKEIEIRELPENRDHVIKDPINQIKLAIRKR